MKFLRKSLKETSALVLLLAFAVSMMAPAAIAQTGTVPDRTTGAYIAAAPNLLGKNQPVTINLWILPAPSGPTWWGRDPVLEFGALLKGYQGVVVTFTRPDGTKDTFQPVDLSLAASVGSMPGVTTTVGTIRFEYIPQQTGNWAVQFNFPGTMFGTPGSNDTVWYKGSSSNTYTFTVQDAPVSAGLINGGQTAPLPTGFWQPPVNTNNREWYQISADWLQSGYDQYGTKYNPYSTGPNTGHILWTYLQAQDGLLGGPWGSDSYENGGNVIVMDGRVYVNKAGSVFDCIDLITGKTLYTASGQVTLGQHLRPPVYQTAAQVSETVYTAYLWQIAGSTWTARDPLTGAVLLTLTNAPSLSAYQIDEGDSIVFCSTVGPWNTTLPLKYASEYLIKWDLNKVVNNNWLTGVVWNVSVRQPDGVGIGDNQWPVRVLAFPYAGTIVTCAETENKMFGFNMTDGKYLWRNILSYPDSSQTPWMAGPAGPIVLFESATNTHHAFDVATGKEIWTAQFGVLPWASIPAYYGMSDGNKFYKGLTDGHVYAINWTTGHLEWQSQYVGDSNGETVQNTWTFGGSSAAGVGSPDVAADGKLYWATTTVYRLQPKTRYNELIAINATTGKFIWTLPNSIVPSAISDGVLLGTNDNDGKLYAISKGQTATSVTATQSVLPAGASTLIQGSVLDMSPAQPGTPAVADSSMSIWMDYLHLQNATLINNPPTPNGVPVTLTAVDSTGSAKVIGTVTSDGSGLFKMLWTPTTPGEYTIYANFAGSESYWSSSGTTAVGVTAAASAAPTPTASPTAVPTAAPTNPPASPYPTLPPSLQNFNPMDLYMVIAVVAVVLLIAIAIVAVVVIRKK